MVTFKDGVGLVAVVLTVVGYASYFQSIFKRQTKPHAFTWVIGTLANGIVFVGQWSHGGGAGSWVTAFTGLLCFMLVGISVKWGEKDITRTDVMAFAGALAAIALWYFTDNPLWAICLATVIDILGCYPTARKSYHKPYEESVFSWSACTLRSALSLFALEQYTPVTVIYPLALVFVNGGVTALLVWRRQVQRA